MESVTPGLSYVETCCWRDPGDRQMCPGGACICRCHRDPEDQAVPALLRTIARQREQLRVATDALETFAKQRSEPYPGWLGTHADDALIQISVVE